MTPPTSAVGSFAFDLQSYNAIPNTTLNITVTGLASGMTEDQVAYTINQQASAQIAGASAYFNGYLPTFLVNPVTAMWAVANTDHVEQVYCTANFTLTVTSNTTGAKIKLGTAPILATVAEALAYSPLLNAFYSSCGGALDTDQIIDLLNMASSDVVSVIRNPIVSSLYVFQFTCQQTNSVQLPNYPVQYYYLPFMVRPVIYPLASPASSFTLQSIFTVNSNNGWMTYRFAQDMLFNYEPYDWNNMFIMGFRAGYYHIPQEIITAVVQYAYMLSQGYTGIKSLSDGVTKIEYEIDRNLMKREIFSKLRVYMR